MERKSEDELEEVQRPGGGRLMQSEFNKGAAYARDCILAKTMERCMRNLKDKTQVYKGEVKVCLEYILIDMIMD